MALTARNLAKLLNRTVQYDAELDSLDQMVIDRTAMDAPGYDAALGNATRAAADARIADSRARLTAMADWCDTLADDQATQVAVYIRSKLGI